MLGKSRGVPEPVLIARTGWRMGCGRVVVLRAGAFSITNPGCSKAKCARPGCGRIAVLRAGAFLALLASKKVKIQRGELGNVRKI